MFITYVGPVDANDSRACSGYLWALVGVKSKSFPARHSYFNFCQTSITTLLFRLFLTNSQFSGVTLHTLTMETNMSHYQHNIDIC